MAKREKTEEEVKIAELEREVRRQKALLRTANQLVRTSEADQDLVRQLVAVAKNSAASAPEIEKPRIYKYPTSKNEEVVILLMSDVHIGKKTRSYNPTVFVKRLRKLEHNMMSIVTAQRSIRPIRKLVIVMNGDIIDAEALYPSQAVDHIAIPIIDQLYSVGVPRLTEFLNFCLANFQEVEVFCQKGNHGRQNAAKWSSSKSTNWDFVLYKSLEIATQNQPRLKWNIQTKDWKQWFRVFNQGFMACHGDMIRMYYNLPWYGMTRQTQRWQNAYRDKIKLTHFLFGHFHSASVLRFNNCLIYVNGSFVTDDPFSEEHLGVASTPEQLLFAVHPKHGVTWHYKLKLA